MGREIVELTCTYINRYKTNSNEVKHDYLFSIFRRFMFLACIVPQKIVNKNMRFYTIFLYDHSSNFYDSCNLKIQTFYPTLNFWLTHWFFHKMLSLAQYLLRLYQILHSLRCKYRISKLAKRMQSQKYQSYTEGIILCDTSSIQL